ncbi:hypothetical protein MD484_g2504, partial [Candolleomyces efflorescens]
MQPTTNTDISVYREAAVVSGLSASVAAQMFAFFIDSKNYKHASTDAAVDQEKTAARCTQYMFNGCYDNVIIASSCYYAAGINLLATVTAFILIHWEAKLPSATRLVWRRKLLGFGHTGSARSMEVFS